METNYNAGYPYAEEKSLWTYYKECLTKNYINYEGRARRREFWGFVLFNFLISMALSVLGMVVFGVSISGAAASSNPYTAMMAVFSGIFLSLSFALIYGLAVLLPSLCVAIRRMHDRGKSGWYIGGYYIATLLSNVLFFMFPRASTVFVLILLAYVIYLIVQFFLDSEPGSNKWGDNPKGLR